MRFVRAIGDPQCWLRFVVEAPLLIGCLLVVGCSSEERKLSDDPAEIEKRRQEHMQTMQREAQEAGGS